MLQDTLVIWGETWELKEMKMQDKVFWVDIKEKY